MSTLESIKTNKDVRKKILFTLLCITLFRIGSVIPLPIVKIEAIKSIVEGSSFFSLYELFSGGGFSTFSLFALGISPYITASIAIHMLTIGIPSLEELSEEGEQGQKKIKRYTKILGLAIAFIQSIGLLTSVFRSALISDSFAFIIFASALLTFGVYLLTVMDSKIEKHGVGKGASIIICTSILSRVPHSIKSIGSSIKQGNITSNEIAIFVIGILIVTTIVIAIQEAVRKVNISYARYKGTSNDISQDTSYLPLKINQASITPVIFAQTILALPQMVSMFLSEKNQETLMNIFNPASVLFNIILVTLIVFFNYFYTSIAFDVDKISDNLKKANAYVSGLRPGEQTADYLGKILSKLVFLGSVFLVFITLLPTVVSNITNIETTLLGTSLLIITSVSIDLIKQIKSYTACGKKRKYLDV